MIRLVIINILKLISRLIVDFTCDSVKDNSHLRYKVLLDLAPFGFILLDLDGTILEVNKTALILLGSPSEEETKQINMLTYPRLQKAGISDYIRSVIGNRVPVSQTFEYVSKWGKQLCMKVTACSIFDKNDNICFITFIMEDLTIVEKLRDQYYKIARTLASVVDSIESYYIWAKDTKGIYHVVNKSYAALHNKQPMDIVGCTDFDLYPFEMASKFTNDDKEVLSSCGIKEITEFVESPKNGKRMWKTTKNAICDEDNKALLTVGIAEDITDEYERKKLAHKAIKELESIIKRVEVN